GNSLRARLWGGRSAPTVPHGKRIRAKGLERCASTNTSASDGRSAGRVRSALNALGSPSTRSERRMRTSSRVSFFLLVKFSRRIANRNLLSVIRPHYHVTVRIEAGDAELELITVRPQLDAIRFQNSVVKRT